MLIYSVELVGFIKRGSVDNGRIAHLCPCGLTPLPCNNFVNGMNYGGALVCLWKAIEFGVVFHINQLINFLCQNIETFVEVTSKCDVTDFVF